MKIELVGGAHCGTVMDVKYLDPQVKVGRAELYRRRDKSLMLSSPGLACYGQAGHRMYDYQKGDTPV